ncbi:MAG: hypothetical protein CM15mL2_2480 [Caudoviricetes sp.]|nr:MAG: hypothetical protein CM15mL2_2480 [Caudoviricetes sp.]
MAKLGISTGTTPNDGTGDSLLDGAVKVNSNFDEVYGKIGDGTNLFVGIVSSITVSGPLSISTTFGAPVITGLANTANINANNFQVTGVGTITGTTKLAGINTFSDAGYTVAGVMTASNIISNETIKVAGIVTTSADGINVSAGVTARTLAIQNVTETDHFVGLNTVFIDHTGIAATTLTITDTATIGFGSVTSANITTINSNLVRGNSGILTTAVVGTAITIHSAGIDAGQAGVITATTFVGALTGNVTGTASSATRADLAYGLLGTPNIVVGVATLGGHKLNEAGAFVSGILTAASFSVGANEVVSSARQLKNIATLDATTKLTIENAISDPPNDFDDLNVVGLATVNTLFVGAHTKGLNIIGVTTGLAVPGISTLGIVTGATSLQATDVYTNFLHGNGANITGISTLNITNYGVGLGGGGSAGVTVQDEGSALSTTATTLNFVGSGVVASGSGATKTITINTGTGDTADIRTNTLVVGEYSSGISTFAGAIDVNAGGNITGGLTVNQINVTGVSTFGGNVDVNANIDVSGSATVHNGLVVNGAIADINHQIVGIQTNNVIPFYYAQVSDFPSASTYHGAVAHGHDTGLMYYAHGGNWLELVSKNSSGVTGKVIVGSGVTIDQNNIDAGHVTGIVTAKSFVGDLSDAVTSRWVLGANGSNHYTFTGPGGLSAADDPTIYLARGQTYEFDNQSGGNHPFHIQTSSGAYNASNLYTTGVTNAGAAVELLNLQFHLLHQTHYIMFVQNHSAMVGTIVIYPSI